MSLTALCTKLGLLVLGATIYGTRTKPRTTTEEAHRRTGWEDPPVAICEMKASGGVTWKAMFSRSWPESIRERTGTDVVALL